MRYIARISPAPNPLQAVCYGSTLAVLRGFLKSMPTGTRADVYERVEVHVKTFTKGDNDVVLEEVPVPPTGHTGGAVAAVAQSGDAGAARKDGDPVK